MRPDAGSDEDGAPAGMLPDEPLPVRLMNTIWADRHGVHDALERPAHLARWLVATGVAAHAPQVGEADLERARELRDALRRLAALVTSDDRAPAALALRDPTRAVRAVNAAAERGLVTPRLQVREGVLRRNSGAGGSPVAAALSVLAVESIDLLTGVRPRGRCGPATRRAVSCTSSRTIRAASGARPRAATALAWPATTGGIGPVEPAGDERALTNGPVSAASPIRNPPPRRQFW